MRKQELTETRHPGRIPAPTMAASERLPALGATSSTVPARQPAPPRGTSAVNHAAAAEAMDGRSTLALALGRRHGELATTRGCAFLFFFCRVYYDG